MARSSPPSQVSPKTAATVALTILFIGFWVWFLWRTAVVLALTMAAVLIAVALNRAVHWLEEHRVPSGIGILLSVLAVFAALVGLGFLLVPPAVTQVSALITHWPDLLQKLQQSEVFRFADRYLSVNELIGRLRSQGASLVAPLRSLEPWPSLLVAGIVAAGVSSLLFLTAIRMIGGTRTGILMLLEPVVGVVLAALWLGEALLPLQVVGGALVLAGALVLQLRSEPALEPLAETSAGPVV